MYFNLAFPHDSLFIGKVQIASTLFIFARFIASIKDRYEKIPDSFVVFEGNISKSPKVSCSIKSLGIGTSKSIEACSSIWRFIQYIGWQISFIVS